MPFLERLKKYRIVRSGPTAGSYRLGNREKWLQNPSDRFGLTWLAGVNGLPQLNAAMTPASADDAADGATKAELDLMNATDHEFEILGTNAVNTDITYHAEGGVKLLTAGADGDEAILLPHLNANQSAWNKFTWGTDQETYWESLILSGAAITNNIIWAGLKLTNTEVKITDADQVYFRYENGVAGGNWEIIDSIGGTDVVTDTGVAVAVDSAYHVAIEIDSLRRARCYLNGVLEYTSGALTTAKDLIPYIGVAADGAAEAKHIIVRGQAISRLYS